MNNIKPILGKHIHTVLIKQGITQRRLADELNLTYCLINGYISGKHNISLQRLYDISQILDVSILDLMPDEIK